MKHRFFRLLALVALFSISPLSHADTVSLTGAGSSAAKLVYQAWGERFTEQTGIKFDYDAVGSSEGIRRILDRKVAFGASDVAPDAAMLAREGLVLVPTVVTGAVPVVNLPELRHVGIQLDGPTLADIFAGSIKRWNAPEIRVLNPGIALPDMAIRPVVRSDGSGTTFNFTDYLAKVSTSWRTRFGAANRIEWVEGVIAAKGSSGIVKAVQGTPGSIGYVDYSYVLRDSLQTVALRNQAARFVSPTLDTFRSALIASSWHARGEFTSTLTNMPGAESWPITMGTFVLLPKTVSSDAGGSAPVRFFLWAFMNGDALAANANFVRLPDPVQAKAYRALSSIHDTSGKPLAYEALSR